MIIWPALAALFAWPLVHECGSHALIYWSAREIFDEEHLTMEELALPNGARLHMSNWQTYCPYCGNAGGEIIGGWDTYTSGMRRKSYVPEHAEPLAPPADFIPLMRNLR